jgi:hypothetical protein
VTTPDFKRVAFVDDGMEIYFLYKGNMILCRVACAMGDTARVVNELHGIDTWAAVDELRERKEARDT